MLKWLCLYMAMHKMMNWATGLVLMAQAFLLQLIAGGGEVMMSMFFAQRVIFGKTAFKDVPTVLKAQVRELLIDSGLGELAEDE